ncbi:MAG: hypothetical protein ACK4RZ_14625 [Paracoccaceae bacterium]
MSDFTELALVVSRQKMVDVCVRRMQRLAGSANELLAEPAAREEIDVELSRSLLAIACRDVSQRQHETRHPGYAACYGVALGPPAAGGITKAGPGSGARSELSGEPDWASAADSSGFSVVASNSAGVRPVVESA